MLSRRKLFGFLVAAPVGAVAAAKSALAYADGGAVFVTKQPYGLFGECGTEFIMPLRRMSDGKFGIGRETRSVVTVRSPS